MPGIYGELQSAQFECLSSDPANAPRGRAYFNTSSGTLRVSDGTVYYDIATPGVSVPSAAVVGSPSSPQAIVAATGISATSLDEVQYIEGSGGAVDISASPQIAAGTNIGQTLELNGCSNTNTVLLEDGTGLSINGPWLAELDSCLGLRWNGTNWSERYRR